MDLQPEAIELRMQTRDLPLRERLYCLLTLISGEFLAQLNSMEDRDESSTDDLQTIADLAGNLIVLPDTTRITEAMYNLCALLAAEELRRAGLLMNPIYPATLEEYCGISASLIVEVSRAGMVLQPPEVAQVSVQARNLYHSMLAACTSAKIGGGVLVF
jgi:hypothetical protein